MGKSAKWMVFPDRVTFIGDRTNFASARALFGAHSVSAHGKASVSRRHHVYKAVWTTFLGAKLPVQPQDHNDQLK